LDVVFIKLNTGMSDKICLIDKYLKELGFKEVEMSFIDSIAPYLATSLYAHRYDAIIGMITSYSF
jgi:hypothetical protein